MDSPAPVGKTMSPPGGIIWTGTPAEYRDALARLTAERDNCLAALANTRGHDWYTHNRLLIIECHIEDMRKREKQNA